MEETSEYTTPNKIDKNSDNIKKRRDKICYFMIFIGLITLLIIFWDKIFYRIEFSIPIPSAYESTIPNTALEPVQINYNKEEQGKKVFVYKSLLTHNDVKIYPRAKYEISGLVVAYNKLNYDKSNFFDSTALYDIGLAWGKLGEKEFYTKYYKSYSEKDEETGARLLWTEEKTSALPVSGSYSHTHFSHSHIIPANRNIISALLIIKNFDKVELEGELVDIQSSIQKGNKIYTYSAKTSLNRTDSGIGACETIFVTRVKIGHLVFK